MIEFQWRVMTAKNIFIFIAIATTAACTGLFVKEKNSLPIDHLARFPSAVDKYGYLILKNPLEMPSQDLSFAELEKILREQKFSKIEDLLKYLAEKKPEYMSHYTLGFSSLSLHESSKQFPRSIVYGTTGKFIITFNGHSSQQAYEMLEVVEFNTHKKVFEFREIEFNEFNQLNSPYKISSVNGPRVDSSTSKCLQCHGEGRPLWNAYDIWPGFYGGDDDFPMSSNNKRGNKSGLGLEFPPQVKNDWQDFQERYRVGRYKHLKPLASSVYIEGLGPRPNSDLSIILTQLNGYRIGQMIKNAGGNLSTAAALVYALDCQNRAEVVPKNTLIENLDLAERPRMKSALESSAVDLGIKLMSDLNISLEDYRSHWLSTFDRVGEPGNYIFNRDSKEAVLRAHIRSGYSHSALISPLEIGVSTSVSAFIGTAKALVPKANIEKWPTNIQEDIHNYENGVNSTEALRTGIVDAMVPANLKKLFAPTEDYTSSYSNYCAGLKPMMPPEFR